MPVVVLYRCPVSTVETSLFDNRDRYAQCYCAFVSCLVGVSWTAEV